MKWQEIGRSVEGRPIRLAEFGRGGRATLILGGYHGDEPVSADLARRLADYLKNAPSILQERVVVIVPEVNPDGLHYQRRQNRNGVDLNRNLPTPNWRRVKASLPSYGGARPGSEPETRAVLSVLQRYRFSKVITIHEARGGPMLDYNGPAAALAKAMSRDNHYPVGKFFGEVDGSLGSYVGMDKGIPIITLELLRAISAERAWEENRAALLTAIRY